MSVLSGSMEPYYPVGCVVYVNTTVVPGDIEVGDVITVRLTEESVGTHRVIEIDSENQLFYTKGDANEEADFAPSSFDSLIGKAGLSIPLLGYVALNMRTKYGIMVGCAILAVLVILLILPVLLKKDEPTENKTEEEGLNEKV